MKFTLEEIYLIRSCNSKCRTKIVNELNKYLKINDATIVEMANNVLTKLNKASDDELLEVIDYPL